MRRPLDVVLLDVLEDSVLNGVIANVSRILDVDVNLHGGADHDSMLARRRERWRADEVIRRYLDGFFSSGRFVVGLVGTDLYMPSLNFVFGLAMREEGTAVVSWYRLRDGDSQFAARLSKEVIHEVGHLEGLDHCPNETCVMRFSNTLSETDAKGLGFCSACARKR